MKRITLSGASCSLANEVREPAEIPVIPSTKKHIVKYTIILITITNKTNIIKYGIFIFNLFFTINLATFYSRSYLSLNLDMPLKISV